MSRFFMGWVLMGFVRWAGMYIDVARHCFIIKSSLPSSSSSSSTTTAQRSDTVIKNSNTKNNNATDTEPDTPSSAVSVVSYYTDMKRVNNKLLLN